MQTGFIPQLLSDVERTCFQEEDLYLIRLHAVASRMMQADIKTEFVLDYNFLHQESFAVTSANKVLTRPSSALNQAVLCACIKHPQSQAGVHWGPGGVSSPGAPALLLKPSFDAPLAGSSDLAPPPEDIPAGSSGYGQ